MHYRTALKGLAVAGSWVVSIIFLHSAQANEVKLPASLQSSEVLLPPSYIPVTAPAVKVPAVGNWIEVNQTVHDIGGWMFYASESATEDKQQQKPEPQPHNHKGH